MMRQGEHKSDSFRVPTFDEAAEFAIASQKGAWRGSTQTERDWRGVA